MKRNRVKLFLLCLGAGPLLLLSAGCTSTPKHTDALMFGTTTKLAIDVSQDVSTGVGVTVGYKRVEAVWMPLLPNQSGQVPAACAANGSTESCPKYVGNQGSDKDAYSVLASFGSKMAGGGTAGAAGDAKVQGEIVQFFATGLAARHLANSGGAALVNTQQLALTPEQAGAVGALEKAAKEERSVVIAAVKDNADGAKVDKTKMAALLAKATGAQALSGVGQARIGAATQISDLQKLLIIHDADAAKLASLAK